MDGFERSDLSLEVKEARCADVIIKKAAWYNVSEIDEISLIEHVEQVISTTLHYIGFFNYTQHVRMVVLLDGDDTLCKLNKEFRNQDKPTNVLSFPSTEATLEDLRNVQNASAVFLGDIAISYDRVYEESIEQIKGFLEHFTHILVHATLHLVGYDHVKEDDAKRMERIEIAVLHNLGFRNPYVLEHVTDAFIIKL